jgi:hypothetical protein
LTEVLLRSRRRCCLCFGLNEDFDEKKGQVAHLDKDRNNNSPENLAFLCLEHHDAYDSRTSQSKGMTLGEIRAYSESLYAHFQLVVSRRLSISPSASYTREEFEEAIVFHTGTHRSQAVVELVRNGPQPHEAIIHSIPGGDPEWIETIVQGVIALGWVRYIPTRHKHLELTMNGKRMLEVLAQIPEAIKESAWREIWLPESE